MRKFANILTAALALCLPAGAAMADPGTGPKSGQRTVSVGGAITEIIYAVGAGDQIIAVDTTSRYPAATSDLPNVGYMRRLSAEPILALAPDHIIAVADSGPEDSISILQQAGLRFTKIPDVPTVEGALMKIRTVANAVGKPAAGAALATDARRRIDAALANVPKDGPKPRTIFLLSVGRGALLAGGRNTSADAIITLSGGENIAAAFSGYKPIEPEALTARDPEVIIVTERSLKMLGGADAILAMAQFAGTSAAKNKRLIAFDGLMLLGFGPRLPDAIEAMTAALHPSAAAPAATAPADVAVKAATQ